MKLLMSISLIAITTLSYSQTDLEPLGDNNEKKFKNELVLDLTGPTSLFVNTWDKRTRLSISYLRDFGKGKVVIQPYVDIQSFDGINAFGSSNTNANSPGNSYEVGSHFGYRKYKSISKHLYLFYEFGFISGYREDVFYQFTFDGDNQPISRTINERAQWYVLGAYGKGGLEYRFNERLTLSAESYLAYKYNHDLSGIGRSHFRWDFRPIRVNLSYKF